MTLNHTLDLESQNSPCFDTSGLSLTLKHPETLEPSLPYDMISKNKIKIINKSIKSAIKKY